MTDNQSESIAKLDFEAAKYAGQVQMQMAFLSPLEKGIAAEHRQELARLRKDLNNARNKARVRKKTEVMDKINKELLLPYRIIVLDAIDANVRLNSECQFVRSNERFLISLISEGLCISDLNDVVEVYHKAVDDFFELQKDVSFSGLSFVNSEGVAEYKRRCETVTSMLDHLASQTFRRKVCTPADFDVKEKSPHNFLGQINVGFESLMPELVRVIAHEGPFGHYTHQLLTNGSPFQHIFRHTSEGIAVLGEQLALEMQYPPQEGEEQNAMVEILKRRRILRDAMMTAYEKLAFYNRQNPEKIAEAIASRYIPKEIILQQIKGVENRREASLSMGATPYFTGTKLIRAIYDNAVAELKALCPDQEEFEERRKDLLYIIYRGQRPARIAEQEVKMFLENKHKEKDTPSNANQSVPAHFSYLF